jgi:hypothetical protein
MPTTSGTVNRRHVEVCYHPETYQALGGWNGNSDGVSERTQAYMWCVEGARVNNRTHVQMQTHMFIGSPREWMGWGWRWYGSRICT